MAETLAITVEAGNVAVGATVIQASGTSGTPTDPACEGVVARSPSQGNGVAWIQVVSGTWLAGQGYYLWDGQDWAGPINVVEAGPPTGWPWYGFNPVVRTIGATARDHSTIALWEADTDDDCVTGWGAGDYASPCSPVGSCYDDADLAQFDLNGATTDSTHYRRLTAAAGQKHDGTAYSGGVTLALGDNIYVRELYLVVEDLIVSGAYVFIFQSQPADAFGVCRRCVFVEAWITYSSANSGITRNAENCVFHGQATGTAAITIGYGLSNVRACSVLGGSNCIKGNVSVVNCIAIGASNNCYNGNTGGSNNISGDNTDAGADTINNVAAADLFANVGAGTEDLHLKDGATVANDAGADLSAYFTDDIDGETRTRWDIGADEYSGGAPPAAGGKFVSVGGNIWHAAMGPVGGNIYHMGTE